MLFRASNQAQLQIASTANQPIEHTITVLEWPESKAENASLEAEPNDTWQTANETELGQTVWASADDKPYILPLGQTEVKGRTPYQLAPEATQDRLADGGIDWFKLSYNGEQPRLVHFELDLLETRQHPSGRFSFHSREQRVKPYERGIDTVSPPHEVQAVSGNKFTTRVLTKGTYYLRVDANHAFYQLRTASYAAPPYDGQTDAPGKAVRAGMDYLISAGDSWHANTPRHGGVVNRVASNHHETQLCISCHATHFPTRGELIAKQNGYAVNKRSSLQFLVERLANNPRPFYGFPEAYWTNVISASANVMSRLAILVNTYDQEFTGEKRLSLLKGAAGYLKLYYKGRTVPPNDESNGNTPLVSTYEVAWYSWRVFDELVKATNDSEAREYRDLIRTLIEQDKLKNNVDLCYQTLAFATMIKPPTPNASNAMPSASSRCNARTASGQCCFEPNSASVEFQTYHCLYTLALAGYTPDHPQVAKSLKFLLARQQPYGGWYDVKQTYENFGTPFRETQFAVMALSEFYKGSDGKGWQVKAVSKSVGPDALARLQQFDEVWNAPSAAQKQELLAALNSAEPLLRMTAAAALGRVAVPEAVAPLRQLLGDRSKLVQITAAQALRRIGAFVVPPSGGSTQAQAQPPEGGTTNVILGALASSDARTRWAATRVFAQHFGYLANHQVYADKLITLLADSFAPCACKLPNRWCAGSTTRKTKR
jgi:hypothetical protein